MLIIIGLVFSITLTLLLMEFIISNEKKKKENQIINNIVKQRKIAERNGFDFTVQTNLSAFTGKPW